MDEPIRILHVDDDSSFVELTEAFLEREDDRITVEAAASADEGLDRLAERAFDCVVSDYDMPGRNGLEFLEAVRESHPDLPFILFTGKGSEEVASDAVSAGVTDYLQKRTGSDQYELLANRTRNVVEARRSRAALSERTRQLRTLISNLPGMIYRCRNAPGWPMETVEGEVHELTGYTAGELESGAVSWGEEVLHPDDREGMWDTVQAALDAGEPFEVTYRIVTRDDETAWMWERGRGVCDSDGELVALEGFITDVTRRRERERDLERLRERTRELNYTRTVEETAQLAVDTADEIIRAPLSGLHLLNEAGTRLEPVALADEVAATFDEVPSYEVDRPAGSRAALAWEVFRGDDSLYVDELSRSDRLTEATPAESVVLHPVGDHGLFIISSPEPRAFTDTDLLLVEILANHLEAALDRVNREETLRERERRLEQLHDATRDLVRAETRSAIAERVVDAAEEILGFSVAVVRLYDPETDALVPVAESAAVGDPIPEREPFDAEGGSRNWAAFETKEPQLFDDVETLDAAIDAGTGLRSLMILPIGEYGTISVGDTVPGAFDATDEFLTRILATAAETAFQDEERNRRVRQQRDELERQNERLEEFASVVSHDLRNPLSVATGRLELAREAHDDEHLRAVANALDRMETLIDDLLTLARHGARTDELEPVDLRSVAEAGWRNVDTTNATLTVDATGTVEADRSRLQQLLENLYRNSVEHGSTADRAASGDPVSVRVVETPDGFAVADDGPGIDPDRRAAAFDVGYTTSADGSGFGLAIVEQVATEHGWAVRLTDAEGGGTRVEVSGVAFVD